MTAQTLMIQGTASNVGKSLITAGLIRAFTDKGIKVLPFKPQNMSNNAAVSDDGGEIGRAQALQARAARAMPQKSMNPILLKPEADGYAQLVIMGKAQERVTARSYHALKKKLMPHVLKAFSQLQKECELILIEGAGSPAEINLREHDIANMGFACAVGAPVILLADINQGGAFASLKGTFDLLTLHEQKRIKGYLINQFRGDASLLTPAIQTLTAHTHMPHLGTIPYLEQMHLLPAEDSLSSSKSSFAKDDSRAHIHIVRLPHIANSDDFDPLFADSHLHCAFIKDGAPLTPADLIVIPGSKAVRADLRYLFECGWAYDILAHAARGGAVLGLCGGYQMLGKAIHDPHGIEGDKGSSDALNLLECETTLHKEKTLLLQNAVEAHSRLPLQGYEIHNGATHGKDCSHPLIESETPSSSAVKDTIAGCYLHGIFHNDEARHALLGRMIPHYRAPQGRFDHQIEDALNRLARHLETHIELDKLLELAQKAELKNP